MDPQSSWNFHHFGDTVTCQASAEDAGKISTASVEVTLCAFSTCDESIHVGNGIGIT